MQPEWRPRKAIMMMRVCVSGGGGYGFREEVAVTVEDVVAVPPQMRFANERFGKTSAERGCDAVCRDIIRVNVVGGR